MRSKDGQLTEARLLGDSQSICGDRPREHILVEPIEQKKRSLIPANVPFRELRESRLSPGLKCVDGLCRQQGGDGGIHIALWDDVDPSQLTPNAESDMNCYGGEPKPTEDLKEKPRCRNALQSCRRLI